MTEQDQDLVAKLRNEATIFPMGEMHEMLLAAAGCIEALWQANDTFVGILKQNDNRKEENKTLHEGIKVLKQQFRDSVNEVNGLKAELSAARAAGSLNSAFKQGDIKAQSEEIAKLKQQVEFNASCMADRDATIRELREDIRRIGVESNDFRNRMIREQTLVSQLAGAVEGLSNQR